MSWLIAILLGLIAFALVVFAFAKERVVWSAAGAAIMLGIAGYATQASPGLMGAPKAGGPEAIGFDPALVVDARERLTGSTGAPKDRHVLIADGFARNGRFLEAAEVLRGATRENPNNATAWLAMGNALLAHAEGALTPPAVMAYERAMRADPQSPGAPFFLGLGLAQSGQFEEARSLWADLLDKAPADAPWRGEVMQRMQRLDELIAMQRAMEGGEATLRQPQAPQAP